MYDLIDGYPDKDSCNIGRLYLHENYRGRGFSKQIYLTIEKFFKRCGAKKICLVIQ